MKGGIHPDTIQVVSADMILAQPDAATHTTVGYRTSASKLLLIDPVHIIGVDVSLYSIRRDLDAADRAKQLIEPAVSVFGGEGTTYGVVPASVSLFTKPGYATGDELRGGFNQLDTGDDGQERNYFCTGTVTGSQPSWSAHEDLFGYFADGGLWAEFNAPTLHYGVRVVVRYVSRVQFPPAYHDPVKVMQHYWKCSRGEAEFLDGFYTGTTINVPLYTGETLIGTAGQGEQGADTPGQASDFPTPGQPDDRSYQSWFSFGGTGME